MQEEGRNSASVGKKVNPSDRDQLKKRPWSTPAIRKLKVDQTEAGGGPMFDGNFVS